MSKSPPQPPEQPLRLKCVAVGDINSCKASLLISLRDGPTTAAATEAAAAVAASAVCCDDFVVPVSPPAPTESDAPADWPQVELHLVDTSGQEGHDRMRAVSYSGAHALWLCYSVMRPDSLANVEAVWLPELIAAARDHSIPLILVGTMADLRTDADALLKLRRRSDQRPVESTRGVKIAERAGAAAYVETSARTGRGLGHLLRVTVAAALRQPTPPPTPSSRFASGGDAAGAGGGSGCCIL